MLKQRIVTALILVALLALALFGLPAEYVWVVFAVIVSVAGWEWAGLLQLGARIRLAFGASVAALCALAHLAGGYNNGAIVAILLVAALFWTFLVPTWLSYRWQVTQRLLIGVLLGVVILLATWSAFGVLHAKSPWVLLAAMALVWVADVAAYFAGRKFGKHKLAPSISPGKTWEGVAGAVVGVLVYGLVMVNFSAIHAVWSYGLGSTVVLLVFLTGISVIGDLFESMLKRQAGLKDSSGLLPGHGGVLDRIDSLTSTLPIAALLAIAVT